MPTYTYPFGNGAAAVPGYGDLWQIGFAGTWVANDTWTMAVTSDEGNFTIGTGNLNGLTPTVCMTFKQRIYLGLGSELAFSDNDDPTGYEEQNPGAGFIEFLSQFGSQDSIGGLSQLQGRLAILGSKSIQIWTVDADPSLFNLVQSLNNLGTEAPLSVQAIGDFDVIFLDHTGFRSLRSREVTLNAVPEDIGIAIDSLVQTDLQTVAASTCCAIVEPTAKRYWAYLNGKIYILTRYINSKIVAWSTYIPKDSGGTVFTPLKFVIFNNLVYIRASDGGLIVYGGTNGTTYDATVAKLEIPWLDDGRPKQNKVGQGMDLGISGGWILTGGMTPADGTLQPVYSSVAPQGTNAKDSTFDLQHIRFDQQGTHFKIHAETDPTWLQAATLSQIIFHYNLAER